METKTLKYYLTGYSKSFYNISSYFLACGIFGWIFETVYVWIITGKFTKRGILFVDHNLGHYFGFLKDWPLLFNIPLVWGLPIIEIYGIGGCIIVLTFGKIKSHPVILFLLGMISMTIFEYISSFLLELIFGKLYWDYSAEFMNIQGRICLQSSIAWGLLTLISVYLLKPGLEKMYTAEKHVKHYKIIIIILMSYTVLCTFIKLILR